MSKNAKEQRRKVAEEFLDDFLISLPYAIKREIAVREGLIQIKVLNNPAPLQNKRLPEGSLTT